MKTEFGNVTLCEDGYYIVTNGNNRSKRLHRLIYEKNYGPIPKGKAIHHIDGDKTNNCILNLEMMDKAEHTRLHGIGRTHSEETKRKLSRPCAEETKRKLSKRFTSTGYRNVSKEKRKSCKQGFIWRYEFSKKGKCERICRVNFEALKKEVLKRGWPWEKYENIGGQE